MEYLMTPTTSAALSERELLPCPFCGSPSRTSLTGCLIVCGNGDCDVQVESFGYSPEDAKLAWNTRAVDAPIADRAPPVSAERLAREAWASIEHLLTEECGLHPDEGLASERSNCISIILNTLRAAPPVAGEASPVAGWKLVPIKSNRTMTMAACGFLPSCEHVFGHAGKQCADVWEQMVAAAPEPPTSPQPAMPGCDLATVDAWQPIETAPRDRVGFLYYLPVDEKRNVIDAGYFDGKHVRAVNFHGDHDPIVQPTHWMPLPAPPASAEGTADTRADGGGVAS